MSEYLGLLQFPGVFHVKSKGLHQTNGAQTDLCLGYVICARG